MSETEENMAQTVARLARDAGVFETAKDTSEVPLAVIREGYELKDLELFQATPRRVRENIALTTVESFIAYLNKWKRPNQSVIFCDEKARKLSAVIDYHGKDPSWASHRASYTVPLSREATIWIQGNNTAMNQKMFAEFLEERARDVVNPTGAALLELALKLQVVRMGTFGSAIKLNTGEFQFNYSEENQKGTVEVPEIIELGIPLFHKGQSYSIKARLRYRLHEGSVTFTYKLVEIDEALEHAFGELVKQVSDEAKEVDIYQGAQAAK